MLTVEKIDTQSKREVRRFVSLPFKLYRGNRQWVPPLNVDAEMQLNRKKHPFFEHSDGDFFIAVRDGQDVGRIAAFENKRFNEYHKTRQAQFYFFECIEDQDVARALFERVFEWARERRLARIVGPKGLSAFDGYGMLIDGFERRQMMTMMNYNPPYYPRFMEALGFDKEVDFVSCHLDWSFKMPKAVHRIAERVRSRGTLRVLNFRNKKELVAMGRQIGEAYNKSFVNNWEYYPLTSREVDFVVENLTLVADPKLIKIIMHDDDIVGFVLAFADVSAALQRAGGRLLPFGLFDLLLEMRRTPWVSLNGAGILPEFQGLGGNALLYSEMEKSLRTYPHFHEAELTQVAETAVQMRRDLENVGGRAYKNHRVFGRDL
ncbi:MAG TPA: hypothetical protein VIX58_03095 [Anaerolineae bacterium]